MDEVTWRAATDDDATALVGLLVATEAVAPTGRSADLPVVRAQLAAFGPHTTAAFDSAGTMVAFGEVAPARADDGVCRIRLTALVAPGGPAARADRLYEWVLGHAEAVGRDHAIRGEVVLGTRCHPDDARWREALAAHRFSLVTWQHSLFRSPAGARPAPPVLPEGLSLAGYDRDHDEAVRALNNAVFADDPASTVLTAQQWPEFCVGLDTFLPAASCVVLDAAASRSVVGYLLAQREETAARILVLGTSAEQRRRGVARAMLLWSLQRLAADGFGHAVLEVNHNNAGARALYAQLGFVEGRSDYLIWMRRITDDGA